MSHKKQNLLIFTGAGVSAESGIKTFRDHGGLWENYHVEEVAHIDAWKRNPQLVLDFYNMRHAELEKVVPNAAHKIIAQLENYYNVTLVTQNVDDLHERGGSDPDNIVHLHGSLLSIANTHKTKRWHWPYGKTLSLSDKDEQGQSLRPDIVWFGEMLDQKDMDRAFEAAMQANVCVIVGTSMQVYPASSIPWETDYKCPIYYIDPGPADFNFPSDAWNRFKHIREIASTGMEKLFEELTGQKVS